MFAALDAFLAGSPLSGEARSAALPAHDSPLARSIWKRQMQSVAVGLGGNLWKFVRFTYLPSSSALGVGIATRRELLAVFDSLRAGRPAPLGLVSGIGLTHLARNHQVLAYAARFDEERATLWIYDPNHPRRDDVTLEVPMDPHAPVLEHIGTRVKPWRGLFVERYSPAARSV